MIPNWHGAVFVVGLQEIFELNIRNEGIEDLFMHWRKGPKKDFTLRSMCGKPSYCSFCDQEKHTAEKQQQEPYSPVWPKIPNPHDGEYGSKILQVEGE